jgi:predicted XRE-type DNA-binding protein
MPKHEKDPVVTPSFGNVFADLGFADAEERKTKVRLALAINQILERRRLPQAEAARRLGVNQPKVSALANYRLEGFSVERLMHFLNASGPDLCHRSLRALEEDAFDQTSHLNYTR